MEDWEKGDSSVPVNNSPWSTDVGKTVPQSGCFPSVKQPVKLSFMSGAKNAQSNRTLRNTGPIELRELGPNGRPLGTPDDCYDGSPWELHRGELVETMSAKDIHSIVMMLLGALFYNHTRRGYEALCDVYCELSDEKGPSLRAPDVVLVHEIKSPQGDAIMTTPLLAVEVRATQSKKHLAEKVELYLEHDWPEIWLVHTDRKEVEVVRQGMAPIVYRQGMEIQLIPELDRYGLTTLPVAAFFDEELGRQYSHEWITKQSEKLGEKRGEKRGELRGEKRGEKRGTKVGEAKGRSSSILDVLLMRGLDVSENVRLRIRTCVDMSALDRWFKLAMTSHDVNSFIKAMD